MTRALLCVLLVAAACPWAAAADEYPVKVYPCPRLAPPPVIDGSPDDACWATAPLVSGFTRYNKPVLLDVQASFRVGYDDQCLYFAVLCDEPLAAKLTPSFAGRDSSGCFRGETIEIFLDPRHDHTDYYQFAVNLAGSFYDSHKADAYWNSAARLGTKLGAKGWTLELAIPWRDVGLATPRPGAVVGFNVCRDRYAGGAREWSNWSQTMANFHDAPRFGHLVLSPLHTNDAPSAIPRLIDLGLPPFLVASAVQAIMAQRLVRKLCKKCRRPHVYSEDELRAVGLRPEDVEGVTLYRAVGCASCKHTGYRGRLGVFELLEMDETLRDMTYRKAPLDEIRHQARLSGMVSLQEDGLRKILAGITSLEEVLTATHETLE